MQADDPSISDLDDIEVVYLGDAIEHIESEPGLRMTWHQGTNRFGLLGTVRRLAHQAGALDSLPFYLRLAIDEPHSPAPDGSRLWLPDLPFRAY
jgi:hypothetical protein